MSQQGILQAILQIKENIYNLLYSHDLVFVKFSKYIYTCFRTISAKKPRNFPSNLRILVLIFSWLKILFFKSYLYNNFPL